tara:strand:- start:657 stop:923 length:267 start_codon:yes stop_codon:yes gene_type:complete
MARGRTSLFYASNPKARQRHRDYMAQYNATPAKKAYRRRLAAARRARGMMGKGGDDLSHDSKGNLARQSMHINRANNGHGSRPRYRGA